LTFEPDKNKLRQEIDFQFQQNIYLPLHGEKALSLEKL
jgi:hypothetical protein